MKAFFYTDKTFGHVGLNIEHIVSWYWNSLNVVLYINMINGDDLVLEKEEGERLLKLLGNFFTT